MGVLEEVCRRMPQSAIVGPLPEIFLLQTIADARFPCLHNTTPKLVT